MRNGLPDNHGLPPVVFGVPELLPTGADGPLITDVQFQALDTGICRNRSVLVSAPTSTGKTLIGWWAIAAAVANGGRAVYLVSHRALAKQKSDEAQRLFLNNIFEGDRTSIVCATGDSVEDASGRKTNAPLAARLLIATYEKFLGCLSVGGPPRDLSDICFICDEIQLIGDKSRGRNVELLLTLLRRSGWQQMVALSAVLSEKDGNDLADWLNLVVVRNPTREKSLRIECRSPTSVHEMSAAPGRIGDIIEIRQSRELNTIRIVAELQRRPELSPVIVFCMKVDDTFELCQAWTQGKAVSVEVAIPVGLELDGDLERALGKRAAFHNAELSEDERMFVEARLAAGFIDVVFATSTLAAGVNFPLGSAVFSDWRRWNFDRRRREPIGRAEFQNMAGRVGRMGQAAEEGLVIVSAENVGATNEALRLINLAAEEDLGIGISRQDFGSIVLQLFAGRLCSNRREAFELLASTLSASREAVAGRGNVAHWEQDVTNQIDRLIRAGCLVEGRAQVSATTFGVSVARTGLKPETALYFIDALVRSGAALVSMLPSLEQEGSEDDLLFVIAHTALTSPEFTSVGGSPTRMVNWRVARNLVPNTYARRLEGHLVEAQWAADVGAANGALLVTSWAAGGARQAVEAIVPGVRLGTIEGLARDVSWLLTGISEIIFDTTSPSLADESKPPVLRGQGAEISAIRRLARAIRRQSARIGAGLPSNVVWLSSLELRGPRRRLSRPQILALRHQGLTRPHELMDGTPGADQRRRLALAGNNDGPGLSNQVRDAARTWKAAEREHFRRHHQRRSTRFDPEGLIDALYSAKGLELEAVFERVMALIAIGCERLDKPQNQAFPDFLIAIENLNPIVVEIKSRANDSDLVTLNSVTEVLSASELIGLRDNFCLTVCSPGVEPSVPATIESCGRLCALEVTDLAEAVLRVLEGSLTREGIHNWLTTPGIALREDLPAPR